MIGRIYILEPIVKHLKKDVYIGSTCRTLKERFISHTQINASCNARLLFNKYGRNYMRIRLLEEVIYVDVNTLREKEAYYITTMECINKKIPGLTHAQSCKRYYEKNKEILKEKLFIRLATKAYYKLYDF